MDPVALLAVLALVAVGAALLKGEGSATLVAVALLGVALLIGHL